MFLSVAILLSSLYVYDSKAEYAFILYINYNEPIKHGFIQKS